MPDIKDIKTKPVSDEFKKKIRNWRPPADDEPLIPVSFGKKSDELDDNYGTTVLKTGEAVRQSHEVPEIPTSSQIICEQADQTSKSIITFEDAPNREVPINPAEHPPTSEIITNILQTSGEHTANLSQTYGKHDANVSQTYAKHTANVLQKENGNSPRPTANIRQTSREPVAKHTANHTAKHTVKRGRVRNLIQPMLTPTSDIRGLSILQKRVTLFLYDSCNEIRERHTNTIYSKSAASTVGVSVAAFRGAIDDLISKQITDRRDWKDGPGGWTDYWLADATYQEILELEQSGEVGKNILQSYGKHTANHVAKHTANHTAAPSSSSSLKDPALNSNSTTNTSVVPESKLESKEAELPDDWKEIDCTALQNLGVKFGKAQVNQVWKWGKVSAEELRLSIEAFAFDIRVNKKTLRTGNLNGFCGILKVGPYGPPDNFESEEDQLRRENEARLLSYLEKKKDERARIRTARFELWTMETPKDQLKKLMPDFMRDLDFHGEAVKGWLKNYFRENVLPNLEQEEESVKTPSEEGEFNAEDIRAIMDERFGTNPN